MGWREALAAVFQRRHDEWKDGKSEGISVGAAVMELSPADRIALARELLAGTGWVPARDVGEKPDPINQYDDHVWGKVEGWNAARAAMLGDETT